MTTITGVGYRPGRVWGVLSLVAIALPLPFLFALSILSIVVRNQGSNGATVEAAFYGFIAAGGLFFFPVLIVLSLVLAITAVRRPNVAGRVMGWVTIAIVILAVPLSWFAYSVWITNS